MSPLVLRAHVKLFTAGSVAKVTSGWRKAAEACSLVKDGRELQQARRELIYGRPYPPAAPLNVLQFIE